MAIRRPWTWLAIAGALGLAGLRFAWPAWTSGLPTCTVRSLTGLHCPGCGGTRCTGRLLEGDLSGALAMNPLVVFLAALAGLLVLSAVVREWTGRKPAFPYLPPWLGWSLVTLIITFAVVRNLPWWPFTLLVPH